MNDITPVGAAMHAQVGTPRREMKTHHTFHVGNSTWTVRRDGWTVVERPPDVKWPIPVIERFQASPRLAEELVRLAEAVEAKP